jgi:hypothetical protein
MSNSSADPQQNVEPQPQNRLTIGFLMLWTLGSAIILACHRAVDDSPPQTALARANSLYLVCFSLVHGLTVAGLMLFVQRKVTKVGGFPIQPGHWLLLIRGFTIFAWLAGWISRVALERLWAGSQFTSTLYLAMQFLPAAAVSCAGYTIALRRNRGLGGAWRLVLRLLQLNAALGLVIAVVVLAIEPNGQMLPYAITSCLFPVIFVILIVALATDRELKSRDFLHWAGGVAALVTLALPFIYQILVSVVYE